MILHKKNQKTYQLARSPIRRLGLFRHASERVLALVGTFIFLFAFASVTPALAQNPFSIDGNVPDAGATEFTDPTGGDSELGPMNSSTTKLGVIHQSSPAMLEFTNPNGQVDLVKIWLATAVADDGDSWLYFAWERNANNGSGVVAYEFQQAPLTAGCNYGGIDQILPEDPAESDLINSCNPWQGRAPGDFLIVWDQKGQSINIILRTFDGTAFDDGVTLTAAEAVAELSGDKYYGEAAVNLSKTVFPQNPTECFSVANIIPGTITGNSDSADYKDTVLANFTEAITISNCGRVTIRKQTDPDGQQGSFDFEADIATDPQLCETPPCSFSLTDDGVWFSIDVLPGTNYTVTELDPTSLGFDLTDIDCSNSEGLIEDTDYTIDLSTGTVTFDIDRASDILDCTYTNTARGEIIIKKVTNPSGATQAFVFSASYSNSGFTLTNGQTNSSGPIEPGTYSVSETVPAGWEQTSATCSDGSTPSSISLQAGETVTCTFNNEQDAFIIVEKQTDPDGSAQKFTFNASYGANFELSDGQSNKSSALDPGVYSVSETVPAGWEQTSATCSNGSAPSSISLQAGETVTCTFTNTIQRSMIIIDKVTDPAGSAQSFAFTASYAAGGFSLTDAAAPHNSGNLLPTSIAGTYSVSETVPDGWTQTSATCSDGSPVNAIDLSPGETVTCTFKNTIQRGTIIVDKVTNPAGSAQSFAFTASYAAGGFSLTDAAAPHNTGNLLPTSEAGTYSVSETVPDGWKQTSVVCSDGSPVNAIDLSPGETVTCTFTNTQDGKIVVEKQTVPNGDPTKFTFTGKVSGALGDGETAEAVVAPGTYSATESVPAGWLLTGIACDDNNSSGNLGTATATFIVEPGETVKCTFTNSTGAIKIKKTTKNASLGGTVPHGGVTFEVNLNGQKVSAVTDANGEACVGGLLPGATYTVTEQVPEGYAAASTNPQLVNVTGGATCSLGTPDTVTFVNDPLSKLVITFHSLAGPGVTKVTSVKCTGPSANGSELGELADGQSATLTDLLEGTYACTIVVDP